jgi:hypothetical protein
MRPYKWLRMLANFLRMPLQMLANALSNACERLTNETTTQRMCGELHINLLPMFNFVTYSPATAEESCECLWTPYTWNDYTTHAWRIAYKHLSNVSLCHLLASHHRILCECSECLRMPLRLLRMLANALANLANACDCLRKCCENNENIIFARNLATCSLIMFYSQHSLNDREFLRTPTNVWRSPCDHCELVANCICMPIRHHIRHCVRAALRIFTTGLWHIHV